VTQPTEKKWGYRHVILTTVWLLYIINFIDRVSVLTFLPYIQKDLHLSVVQAGWLASIFFFGYACAQFTAGILADRIGSKKTMNIAIWIFTLATGLTGFVRSFWQFFCLRLGLALGEGHHQAPSLRMVANWFPRQERARAAGFYSTSWTIAYALTPIVATQLAANLFGGAWRPVFFLLALPGFVGIVCLWKYANDSPKVMYEKGKVSAEEYKLITTSDNGTGVYQEKKYSSKLLLTDTSFYLYTAGMFCYMAMNWGLNVWLTTYLVRQHGFNIKTMGFYAAVPYVAALFANLFGGWFADSKFLLGRARFLTAACFAAVIPTFLMIGYAAKGQTALLLGGLILNGLFFNMPYGAAYSYPAMRYPKEVVGRVIGYSNGTAQFGGFLCPLIAGYLVIERADKSYYFGNVFLFFSFLAAFAIIVFALLNEKPIDASAFEVKTEAKAMAASAS
jgi:sugar phosphate permease